MMLVAKNKVIPFHKAPWNTLCKSESFIKNNPFSKITKFEQWTSAAIVLSIFDPILWLFLTKEAKETGVLPHCLVKCIVCLLEAEGEGG